MPGTGKVAGLATLRMGRLSRLLLLNLALNFGGLSVVSVLTVAHAKLLSLPCGVSGGCNSFVMERASYWFGIPISYYGLVTYAALLGLNCLRIGKEGSGWMSRLSIPLTGAACLISFSLVLYGKFVLHQLCLWCFASAVILTLMWPASTALGNENGALSSHSRRLFAATVAGLTLLSVAFVGFIGRSLDADTGNRAVCDPQVLATLPFDVLVPSDAAAIGPKTADVTIVVFSDFKCPACQKAYGRLRDLANKDPNIRLVYRHFPLSIHPGAYRSAVESEIAAEQGRFWEFADAAAASMASGRQDDSEAALRHALAGKTALSTPSRAAAIARVERDIRLAERLRITSIPALVVIQPGNRMRAARIEDIIPSQ